MAPVAETAAVRLLRPLLGIGRDRLRATLRASRQAWIEDPSNESEAFARVRVRRALPALAAAGIAPGRIVDAAAHLGRARAALEADVARLLAVAAEMFPTGWCRLDPAPLAAAPAEVSLRALAAVLRCIAGAAYVVREARLERLHRAIVTGTLGAARTLGGCIVAPSDGRLIVAREPAAASGPLRLEPGRAIVWDHRFVVQAGRGWASHRPAARIGALGADGFRILTRRNPAIGVGDLPALVRQTLPAVWQGGTLLAAPHIEIPGGMPPLGMRLMPRVALAGALFSVV
jgi:tRNA(Ile)-lysidine synthase